MEPVIGQLMNQLNISKTAYHAAAEAARMLTEAGYERLEEQDTWSLRRGGRYFVVRDGSALIAFCIGREAGGFRIVASHLDSPCLKIKGEAVSYAGGCAKLNVERYGGCLNYSWLDIPVQIAGRVIVAEAEHRHLRAEVVTEPHRMVIPSVAIHFNRDANSTLTLNPQVDLQPIAALAEKFVLNIAHEMPGDVLDADLFVVNAQEPYLAGYHDEFLVSPRIDNLTSAFASLAALDGAGEYGTAVAFLADNEEVGSETKQGAGSDFLRATLARIAESLGESFTRALPHSFLVSCDNAHAIHPNHPEKSDPTNAVRLGGGIVIKHHANQNYTTDAFSSAVFKSILKQAGVPYQDFYMRADMLCGGTLGTISSSQLSIRSVDIGLAQLAMHAATETMCVADYPRLIDGLRAFYAADLHADGYDTVDIR